MGLFKSKPKINYYARLTYSKQTRAEVTKNLFKDKKMLDDVFSREKSYFKSDDFTYLNFENDDNKVFKIFLVASIKDSPKVYSKLESDLKYIFDCNDIEITTDYNEIRSTNLPKNESSIMDFNNEPVVKSESKLEQTPAVVPVDIDQPKPVMNSVQSQQVVNQPMNNNNSNYGVNVNSNESIDSVIRENRSVENTNQYVNNQQQPIQQPQPQPRDDSNYSRSPYEKDGEGDRRGPSKEFKYF